MHSAILGKRIEPTEKTALAKPRVVHLLNSRHFNGAEAVVATIMQSLSDRWDCIFVSRNGPVGEAIRSRGLQFESIPSLAPTYLIRLLRGLNPSVVHAHDYRASLSAAFAGYPAISHLHNNYPWAKSLGAQTLAYRLASPRFKRILAVSDAVIDEHRFAASLRPKSRIVPNGVDVARLARVKPAATGKDLVFVGRMTEQKDPLAFIRIVDRIRRSKSDVSAVMLGGGEMLEQVRQEVHFRNLGGTIEVAGYVSDPHPIVAAAKLGIFPSRWEGFGLAAAETLALKVPVLGSPVGGLETILLAVSARLLCQNEEVFVNRAIKLLDNEADRMALGELGQRTVAAQFSSETLANSIEEVYRELLGQP